MRNLVGIMKHRSYYYLAVALGCILGLPSGLVVVLRGADHLPPGAIVLEDFEKHGTANFPKNWWFGGTGAELVYQIEAEGSYRFLHARAENRGVPIGLQYVFNPKKLQQLRWR